MDSQHSAQNLSIITCFTNPSHIILTKNYQKDSSNKLLVINRNDFKITLENNMNTNKFLKRNFSAFLGIVVLSEEYFAVFCDEVKPACTVSRFRTFEIRSLFFLSFKDEKIIKRSQKRQEIYRKIRDLNTLLTTGFYFSHQYNLTRTLQYQKFQTLAHFVWNNVFLLPLSSFPDWQTAVIQGYVSQFQIFIQGTKIFYILISRRSLKKGGTRYFDRGVNDEGDVANYVQSEQIIKINQYLMSDLQIRGNVPIFFEQKGLTTKIKLTRGFQLTHEIYQKHVQKLIRCYERIFWVNLLSETKKGELIIIRDLQKHVKQNNNKNLKYFFYDFHKATDHKNFEKVDEGLETVQNMKKLLKFYMYDSKKQEVIMRQWGVFRTNCLDCLDRTNFFQSKLAIITFQDILSCFQIKFDQPMLKSMNDPNEQSSQILNFRKIWADNGDAISYHYTGTGSTHTDVIRDGKRGFFGIFKHKYKTVSRFYNQNFWDFYKMRLIDQLLDQKTSQIQNFMIPKLVKERQAEYMERILLDIYLFTWKATKKAPTCLPLLPNSHDIIAISIQEAMQEQKWRKIIIQSIDQNKYILVSQKVSNHNLLMVYSKIELKQAISNVQITKVKFKSFFNQLLSTKCAVIIRFQIHNTSFTFIGCQLEFGRQFGSYRLDNLKDIHRYAFRQVAVGQKQSESILQDDVIFLFGNMNTNVSTGYKDSIVENFSKNRFNLTLQQRRLVSEIIETDQFENIQQGLLQYRYYEQADIKFPPTYKYLKLKQTFDIEVSGWPDRVWFSTEKKIICSKYGVVQELRDQHVPVFANFQVEVQKINEQAKQQVSEQVFSRISQARGLLDDSNCDPNKSEASQRKIQ